MEKTQKTSKLIEHMIDSLRYKPNRTLTKWEKEFVESVAAYFLRKRDISDRQFEILEKLYAEKTA